MLFARGKRQHEAALALGVHRLAAQPARHLANVFRITDGKQPQIRPAKLQADAERLPLAHDDIGTEIARRRQRAQRDGFGIDNNQQRASGVGCLGNAREIRDATENIGILHHHARWLVGGNVGQQRRIVSLGVERRRAVGDAVAGKSRHRADDRDVMRVQPIVQKREVAAGDPAGHADRFPARGRAVIHRRIGHRAAIKPRDLRLEFEQHLQRALRDFGLIGCVGSEKFAALDQMVDTRRNMMAVGPRAKEEWPVAGRDVPGRQLAHMPFDGHLAEVQWQPFDRAIEPRGFGHVDKQIVDRGGPDRGEHRRTVGIG